MRFVNRKKRGEKMAFAILTQGTATPGHVDLVRNALMTLAREGGNASGTIRYEFYQPKDDPTVFFLFAIWENEADWKAHVTSDAHDRYDFT